MFREVFLARATSFGNKFGLGNDTKRVTEECLMQEAASLQEEIALLQAGTPASTAHLSVLVLVWYMAACMRATSLV